MYSNRIIDISVFRDMTSLNYLDLSDNLITDIESLVANQGLKSFTSVFLKENPLDETSMNVYIPQLEKRGVNVMY